MRHLQVLTWARWRVQDVFSPDYCTILTVSVLKPSWEYPIACIAMSIHKGRDKVFMRMRHEDMFRLFVVPEEYHKRLRSAYEEAIKQAEHIIKQQKAVHQMNNLAPGSSIIRTDTGEIIAEAERIIRTKGEVENERKRG